MVRVLRDPADARTLVGVLDKQAGGAAAVTILLVFSNVVASGPKYAGNRTACYHTNCAIRTGEPFVLRRQTRKAVGSGARGFLCRSASEQCIAKAIRLALRQCVCIQQEQPS